MPIKKQASREAGLQFPRRFTREDVMCLICSNMIIALLLSVTQVVKLCLK